MKRNASKNPGRALIPVGLIVFALLLGGVLVFFSENSPLEAYKAIVRGAFGSPQKICELFVKLIPLTIMALGISVAFRAQLWNIGAEGQFIMGSIASAAVAIYIPLPFFLRIPVSLLAAVAAGGAWAALAAWLKNRFNANEVITTLMLNYIADYFLMYLINGPMQDPESDLSQSALIPDEMRLTRLFGTYRLHTGIFIMILVVVFMYFFWRTSVGRRIDLVGQGEKVATYAGIHVEKTVLLTLCISGAFAGLAGWIETFGIQYRILSGIAADYGNIATIVALLGALNVTGILVAAAFFSILLCGGASMQRMTDVPYSVVNVIEGLIIVLIITKDRLFDWFREKLSGKKARKEANHAE